MLPSVMPTGLPWARLLLGLDVPQSPGLGHNCRNKYPEAKRTICLTLSRRLTEPEGRGRRLGWRWLRTPSGSGPNPLDARPATAPGAQPAPGTRARPGVGGRREAGAPVPRPSTVAFEKSQRGGGQGRWGREAQGVPKVTA